MKIEIIVRDSQGKYIATRLEGLSGGEQVILRRNGEGLPIYTVANPKTVSDELLESVS